MTMPVREPNTGTPAGYFEIGRSAEVVGASFGDTADPRLREILQSLVRHLHSFVKEVEPTVDEWESAIAFLTATGHTCDDVRQEFICCPTCSACRCWWNR